MLLETYDNMLKDLNEARQIKDISTNWIPAFTREVEQLVANDANMFPFSQQIPLDNNGSSARAGREAARSIYNSLPDQTKKALSKMYHEKREIFARDLNYRLIIKLATNPS